MYVRRVYFKRIFENLTEILGRYLPGTSSWNMANQRIISVDENGNDHSRQRQGPQGDDKEAVVLLLGWWGAKLRHVQKYSQLYRDRNCATVTAIIDPKDLLRLFLSDNLDEFAQQVASEVATKVRTIDKQNQKQKSRTPVIIHAFSNGGAANVWRLNVLINQAKNKRDKKKLSPAEQDLLLVGDRLEVVLFDSAPCFPSIPTALKAINQAISNPFVRLLAWLILSLQAFLAFLLRKTFGKHDYNTEFWNHMTYSTLARHQIFVYSSFDEVCDVKRLEELIDMKKQSHDHDVTVQKFDDSEHVQHLLKYPKEYNRLLDECLKKAKGV